MKTRHLFLAILFITQISISQAFSQNSKKQTNKEKTSTQQLITKKYKVDGKCSMCKNRIEKAALSIKGVEKADWSIKSHELTLTYVPTLNPKTVMKKIADVGHDNEMYKAKDEVYDKLPSCCKYRQ